MNEVSWADQDISNDVQLAAGGLVWDRRSHPPKLAVIHRRKYGDWTLPKGKPEGAETPLMTARREVQEELGCDFRVENFVGTTCYLKKKRPKVVLFWNMVRTDDRAFLPNKEVDEVMWLTAEQARAQLTHPGERDLVAKAGADAG